MKIINTQLKEYALAFTIVSSFLVYYFDLLKDGMMMSGIFAVVIMVYIGIIWQEGARDEREEFIRSKVDRILYILTLTLIFLDVVYKTLIHDSYMSSVVILAILSLSKIVLSKVIKNNT